MITIIGIVNCTPDSFSDGDPRATPVTYHDRALSLIDAGAAMLDVGGDSTRPGSLCVDGDEEWRRIGPIVEALSHTIPISVDTHKAEVARRALQAGASVINDVSGGADPDLLEVVANAKASYVSMFSATGMPHTFPNPEHSTLTKSNCVEVLSQWWQTTSERLFKAGILPEKQIFDTGLGAFVSHDPAVSLEIMERYWDIPSPPGGRMLGCSRKGFLKHPGEVTLLDRDRASARYGALIASRCPSGTPLYIRVHNVAVQREILTTGSWR